MDIFDIMDGVTQALLKYEEGLITTVDLYYTIGDALLQALEARHRPVCRELARLLEEAEAKLEDEAEPLKSLSIK